MQYLALRFRIAWNGEIRHHEIQKLWYVQARVEDECGRHLLQPEPFQQFVDQRCLAGTHLAGQQHETLAALDAVRQARQGLFRVPRQIEIARIRIDVERVGPKPKKLFIHAFPLDLDLFPVRCSTVPAPPEASPPIAIGGDFLFLGDPRHRNQQGQVHGRRRIFFGADGSVSDFQPDRDANPQCQTRAQTATGKQQPIWKGWRVGQACRIQNVHLLTLLLAFHIGSQLRGTLLRQKIAIQVLRVVVVASQQLVLLFNRRTHRRSVLIDLDLALQPLLISRRLRNHIVVLMNLETELADLRRFGSIRLLGRVGGRGRCVINLGQFLLYFGNVSLRLDNVRMVVGVARLQFSVCGLVLDCELFQAAICCASRLSV